jgi:hypothetical protein
MALDSDTIARYLENPAGKSTIALSVDTKFCHHAYRVSQNCHTKIKFITAPFAPIEPFKTCYDVSIDTRRFRKQI